MKSIKSYKIPLVAATLGTALVAGYSYAHPNGEQSGEGKRGACSYQQERGHHGRGGWGRHGAWSGRNIDRVLETVKSELNVTDAQMPAWETFSESMRGVVQEHQEARQARRQLHKDATELTLIQRLEAHRRFAEQRTAQLGETIDAIKAFYAQLSPEQQKKADQLPAMRRL